MHSVFDHDGLLIGTIELDGAAIIARDRELGRHATAVEALSAVFNAWRQDDAAPERTVQSDAEKVKDFWASGNIRRPVRTLVEDEDQELID